jgi:hypothetical protein
MADDAVEAALNSWWPDHGDRGWANGTPTDRFWYEKMSRALAAADAARGRALKTGTATGDEGMTGPPS